MLAGVPRKRSGREDGGGPPAKVQRQGGRDSSSDLVPTSKVPQSTSKLNRQQKTWRGSSTTRREPFGGVNSVVEAAAARRSAVAGQPDRRHSVAVARHGGRDTQAARRRHTVSEEHAKLVCSLEEEENQNDSSEVFEMELLCPFACRSPRGGRRTNPGKRQNIMKGNFSVAQPRSLIPADLAPRVEQLQRQRQEVVHDIELKDGLHAAEYAQDIFTYLRELEKRDVHSPDFLDRNPAVKPRMREILVDWLIQVQYYLNLEQETLYFAIRILDRVLRRRHVMVSQLQLLGVCALWIGTKVEEYKPGDVKELLRLTKHSYSVRQLLVMERAVLACLDFDLATAGPMVFLNRFLQAAGQEHNDKIANVATYCIDSVLPNLRLAGHRSSHLAAAALYVGLVMRSGPARPWTPTLQYHTGYTEYDLLPVAVSMVTALKIAAEGKTELYGAHMKYGSRRLYDGLVRSKELSYSSLRSLLLHLILSEEP